MRIVDWPGGKDWCLNRYWSRMEFQAAEIVLLFDLATVVLEQSIE